MKLRGLKLGLVIVAGVSGTAFTQSAQALVEIRGGYGLNSATPTDVQTNFNAACGTGLNCGFNLAGPAGVRAEILFKLPGMKFGFGGRYQSLSKKTSATLVTADLEYKYTRLAAVINYRLIDTLVFFGPIISIGVADSSTLYLKDSTGTYNLTAQTASSYSGGLEGGVKIGLWRLGAEVSYDSLNGSNYRTSNNGYLVTNGTRIDNINYRGIHAAVIVGIGL